jgi:hypothetical protein
MDAQEPPKLPATARARREVGKQLANPIGVNVDPNRAEQAAIGNAEFRRRRRRIEPLACGSQRLLVGLMLAQQCGDALGDGGAAHA